MEGTRVWRAINVGLVAAACGISTPAIGFGQERVRVTLPGETIVGVVTRMSPGVLELGIPGGGSREFSRNEVLRTERGFQRDQWHRGYLLGSALGWVAGVGVAFSALDNDPNGNNLWVLATPLGFMAGGYVGYRIGASRKRDAWETVPSWTGGPVRVTLSDSEKVVGEVSRITRDGLELLLPGGPRFVAMGDVARIERRTVRRQWKRGFVVGASVGGGIGLLLIPFGYGHDPSLGDIIGTKVLLTSTMAAFYGFLGAAVGGLFELEGWEPVRRGPRRDATPGLLARMHTLPNGDSSLLLGAKLQF
ncbi:MAG: hypothetical protein OXQ94_17615 [Gemmatimonadota bacterium]|nr:hypothetical protein [Gemmatimonadota bacterium]